VKRLQGRVFLPAPDRRNRGASQLTRLNFLLVALLIPGTKLLGPEGLLPGDLDGWTRRLDQGSIFIARQMKAAGRWVSMRSGAKPFRRSPDDRTVGARLRKGSSLSPGITIRDTISHIMNRNVASLLVLASLIALGCITAGCTDMPGTTSAGATPPAGREAPDPELAAEGAGNISAGNNRFAADLYRHLASDPGSAGKNIFFSPYSISSALAITSEGARGTTADEIASVLHLSQNESLRRAGFAGLDAALNSGDTNYTLRTANALWAEETYPFLPEYVDTAARWYGANVTNLDFINDSEASRETINRWVEEKTEDRIRDLLPAGSIDPMTRLVITNAIYFKGTWVKQFDPAEITEEVFRVAPDETVRVQMMHRTDEDAIYGYAETDSLQVLRMPYAHGAGTELSMLVLLPREDNLTAAEEALNAETLTEIRETLADRRVRVVFPKFTLETEYSLPQALAAMGMPTAFTDAADFSGMDGTEDLFISDVVHKAFVDVNEEGTEAAAATGVVMNLASAPMEDRTPVFRADHPFVFVIVEEDSGTILFAGRVVNPEGS